jgi:hypothetical protein
VPRMDAVMIWADPMSADSLAAEQREPLTQNHLLMRMTCALVTAVEVLI